MLLREISRIQRVYSECANVGGLQPCRSRYFFELFFGQAKSIAPRKYVLLFHANLAKHLADVFSGTVLIARIGYVL